MVDDKNIYDILEKINYILSSCLKLKLPGGVTKTYLDLKDPDKFFCIFLIREITFQKGNYLVTTATCSDGTECKIELRRENFEFWQPSDKIKRFYNPELRCFSFDLNSTINIFKFGIKCAKSICCGEEVRSESLFPGGSSSLFVIHDAFDRYLKK
jgi:hypothetical protein